MSNYEKYLQILNGAKSKRDASTDHHANGRLRNASPLRQKDPSPSRDHPQAYESLRQKDFSKYDFSKVEMPFNFMSAANTASHHRETLGSDENTDLNQRTRLDHHRHHHHQVGPETLDSRENHQHHTLDARETHPSTIHSHHTAMPF